MTENSETGFTKITNDLLEEIIKSKFSGLKLSVILAVIRLTYGYRKIESGLSVAYLTKLVNGSYNKVAEAVKCLIQDSVLTEYSPPGHSKKRIIGINKELNKWSSPNGLVSPIRGIPHKGEKGLPQTGDPINNKETTKENSLYKSIFDHWNDQKIIIHRNITAEMNNSIRTALKDHEPDELKAAIKNYGTVFHSVEHYYKSKYSLEDFLAQKLQKFVEKADSFNKFKRNNKHSKPDKTPRFDNYGKSKNYQFDDTKVL